jgi:hypothetical protein
MQTSFLVVLFEGKNVGVPSAIVPGSGVIFLLEDIV